MLKSVSYAVALAAFCGCSETVAEGKEKLRTVRVSDFGFDAEDSTRFVQAAFTSEVDVVVIDRRPEGPWHVRPLTLSRGNVEIRFEEGAELVAKRGGFRGTGDKLLTLYHADNVRICGKGVVRMRKSDYVKPPYARSEWRHGIAITECRNVRIEDIDIVETGGDGIYISNDNRRSGKASPGRQTSDIEIRNVRCLRNHRQGLSVVTVDGLLVENSEFSETRGTAPEAGIDFEPNHPWEPIRNAVVRNCLFRNNKAYGLLIELNLHGRETEDVSIRVENCTAQGNPRAFVPNAFSGEGPFRSCIGTLVFTNCVAKGRDGTVRPFDVELRYGEKPLDAAGKVLNPLSVEEYRFDADRETVDKCPGKSVPLMRVDLRKQALYLFRAPRAGTYRFKANQLVHRGKPLAVKYRLARPELDGAVLATNTLPAQTSAPFSVDVPAAGFYSLVFNVGYTVGFAITESEVPIAIDGFCRGKIRGCPDMYARPEKSEMLVYVPENAERLIFAAMSGGVGETVRARIYDPSGKMVWDRDNILVHACFTAAGKPMPGFWRLEAGKASEMVFDDFGFDVIGAPPLFFLTPEKYWK